MCITANYDQSCLYTFVHVNYADCLDNTFKVLEACVKNCGAPMHKEVATKEIMDFFRELAKVGIRIKPIMFKSNTNNNYFTN